MKRSFLLLIVLAVLIGIYLLLQKSDSAKVEANRSFVELDSAKVNSLIVTTADETVELTREGDAWRVMKPVSYPAAAKAVETAVGKIAEMKKLSLVTERKDRFNEFQVGDSASTRVTVSDGKHKATFYIGRMSSTGNAYARLDGSNEIWEVGGTSAGTFKKKSKDWRDKTITELKAADFQKFVLRYSDQTITLTKTDTTWTVETPREAFIAAAGSVERITGLLSRMATVDFVDTLSVSVFDQPTFQLEAELVSGEKINLKLVPKDAEGTQYFLRKGGSDANFLIYKATAEVLMRKIDDFKEKPKTDATAAAKGKKT